MIQNLFVPTFGGYPEFFFGRERVLEGFERALEDRGGEYRALIITGVRGCGKTALVEQLSILAAEHGWMTIDLGASDMVNNLFHKLVPQDEQTTTIQPQLSISVIGSGGSLSGGSVSKTRRFGREDLQSVFLDACRKHPEGVFVSIDEAQKVSIDDVAAVCEAFQMATRKGHNAILVLAGLPYAYDAIIHHEGCTFMRRGVHERLTLFSRADALSSLVSAFDQIGGLEVGMDEAKILCETSKGHPYLMQLCGYYLVARANDRLKGNHYVATKDDAEVVSVRARTSYEKRALRPIVDELSVLERGFLQKMARNLNESRVATMEKVATSLGKEQRQLSRARKRLLDAGIILAPNRGEVMFNIPYLADYVVRPREKDPDLSIAQDWGL